MDNFARHNNALGITFPFPTIEYGDESITLIAIDFTMTTTHNLRQVRTDADVSQQDVAFLLNMDTGNLARYERGKRTPTPQILLVYHILFGVPISELLSPLLKEVKQSLIERSSLLLAERDVQQTPKSVHSTAYIQAIVNDLKENKTYDI